MERDRRHRGAIWSRASRDQERLRRTIERALARAEEALDQGEMGEALRLLEALPAEPWADATLHVQAGDAFLELEALERAAAHYQSAIALDPRCSDAHHGLGLVHELAGELEPMIEAWLKVRALDLEQPAPPWGLTLDDFASAAEAALEDVPEEAKPHLDNLPILVSDVPSEELVREGIDPRTLGLITGSGHVDPSAQDASALDCVTLYQRNIERMAGSREEIEDEIRITVLHETAHYFGLDDDQLEELGLG